MITIKTETQIRESIATYETNIRNMHSDLITTRHQKLGKLQFAHMREFAVVIKTLYEYALGEPITGISREVLYNPEKLDAELTEAIL